MQLPASRLLVSGGFFQELWILVFTVRHSDLMLCVRFTAVFQVFVWFLQLKYRLLCRFLLRFILGSLHGLYCTAARTALKPFLANLLYL